MSEILKYQDYMDHDFPFKIQLRCAKNIQQPYHSHEYLQFCYVMKGTCIHRIGKKKSILVKGDMFIVPPLMEHALDTSRNIDTETHLIIMDFMPFVIHEKMKDLKQSENLFDYTYIEPVLSLSKQPLSKISLTIESQTMIEQLLEHMMLEWQGKLEGYKPAVKADLLKFLVILGREIKHSLTDNPINRVVYMHKKSFYESVKYMEENFSREIRLEDVAKIAAMAPSYYSHFFKTIKGRTFIEHLNFIRTNMAIKLLSETDMNITQISQQVGFNNLGHFTRMFKSITGNTPTDYRKLALSVVGQSE